MPQVPDLTLIGNAVPLDRVDSFTLAGNSLTVVPDGYFGRLPNLTDIDLSFNDGLLRLDEGVGFLHMLQVCGV